MRKLVIGKDDAGQRVDRFLRKALPDEALGRIFRHLRTGKVRVNGAKVKPGRRLVAGDEVELRLAEGAAGEIGRAPAAARSPSQPDPEIVVLYRDEHVLAVDKAPFVLVQKGDAGDEPSLDEAVARRFGTGESLTFRPALAHRLDKGTSGVLLFGLSAQGLRGLTAAFKGREVDKRYLALVAGSPDSDEFTVELPLLRDDAERRDGPKVRVSHGPSALPAKTEFRVVSRDREGRFALIEAKPLTGRTHQIRVHLRAAKLPIVGDPAYGDPSCNAACRKRPGLRRQFLHAARIAFRHPVDTDREIVVTSPLPPDLRDALRWAGLPIPDDGCA